MLRKKEYRGVVGMIYITYGDIPEDNQETSNETACTGTFGEMGFRCCEHDRTNEERR